MMLDLFFDRIVILTLKGNEARSERARKELVEKNLSEKAIIYNGVRGSLCGPPKWWAAGKGAWGCMQSHLRIVQDALMDDVEKLLIIEDDTVWQNNAHELVLHFFSELPDDWGQIYLGGQLRNRGRESERFSKKPTLMRPKSVHRTHAFGLQKHAMVDFCKHIMDAESYIHEKKQNKRDMHVDHQLELAHASRLWNVYCPTFWVAGQGENKSDINNRHLPERWWHPIIGDCYTNLPVIVCSGAPTPEITKRLHFGRHISEQNSLIDEGMFACELEDVTSIMHMIGKEAYVHQVLPAIFNWPEKVEILQREWPGGIIHLNDLTEEECIRLCDFPASKIIKHPWINP